MFTLKSIWIHAFRDVIPGSNVVSNVDFIMYCTVNDDRKHMETHIPFVSYSNCMITPMDIDNVRPEKQYCTVYMFTLKSICIHVFRDVTPDSIAVSNVDSITVQYVLYCK